MNAIPTHVNPPPPPFITERERRFAVAYVEAAVDLARDDSDVMVTAYFRAFPAADCNEASARKLSKFLLRRPAVVDLIDHLRREMASRAMVPASRIVQELERMGLVQITDIARIDDKGQLRIDLSRATPDSLAAISQVETKELVNSKGEVTGRVTKVKLSKMDALDRLARIHGMYNDGAGATPLEAIDRAIAKLRSRMGQVIHASPTNVSTSDPPETTH